MRRFRKWLLTTAIAVALALSFAQVASADPGDGGLLEVVDWITTTVSDVGDGGLPE